MLQRKVLPRPTTTTQRERPDSLKCDEGAFWRAAGPRSLLGGGGESSGGGHQLRSGPQMAERWERGGSGENGGMEGRAQIGRSPWRRVPDRSWEGGGEGAGRLVRGPGSFSDTITGHRTPWPHSLQILHMNHSGYLLWKGGRDLLVFKAKIGSVNCF